MSVGRVLARYGNWQDTAKFTLACIEEEPHLSYCNCKTRRYLYLKIRLTNILLDVRLWICAGLIKLWLWISWRERCEGRIQREKNERRWLSVWSLLLRSSLLILGQPGGDEADVLWRSWWLKGIVRLHFFRRLCVDSWLYINWRNYFNNNYSSRQNVNG